MVKTNSKFQYSFKGKSIKRSNVAILAKNLQSVVEEEKLNCGEWLEVHTAPRES